MKILHVLANSSPDVNGYAVRTQMLLQYQKELEGVENIGLTSPWYPDRDSMAEEHLSGTVRYMRSLHPSRKKNTKLSHKLVAFFTRKAIGKREIKTNMLVEKKIFPLRVFDFLYFGSFKIGRAVRHIFRIFWKVVEEKILIREFTRRIVEVAKQTTPDLIHAHTPYRVGIPAMKAARKLGLPFVYEMRGMWEETAVANGRWMHNGPAYRRFQGYETKVLRQADSVICISQTLKEEAVSRGVSPSKITVVPNAVEKTIYEQKKVSAYPPMAVEALKSQSKPTVIGYIGSLREMEGVDLTASAVALLSERGVDVKFFVLSGENGQDQLREHCKVLGIGDDAVIMGPVPHEEVAGFYDLIDLFVVSRPNSRVTRLVTPLKPFEAMAMGKPVIASRLPALEEILEHEKTGLLFEPGNTEDVAATLQRGIDDKAMSSQLGKNAHQWVVEHRTWQSVVEKTLDAYQIAQNSR